MELTISVCATIDHILTMKKLLHLVLFLVMAGSLSSCWTVLVAGAGAAGGYVARDKGYEVQSPVTKE